jgi:hypothetical protein
MSPESYRLFAVQNLGSTIMRGFSESLDHEHCDTEDTLVAIFKFATGALG